MLAIHRLLQNLLAIEEATPYHCSIEASSEADRQCLQGDATFQFENGYLTFNLFTERDGSDLEAHQLIAIAGREDAKTILSVPSQDFEYAVKILSLPHPGTITVGLPINRYKMKGVLAAGHFGNDLAPLTSATMWFEDLPEFRGSETLLYQSGITRSHNDRETPLGFRVLGYLVLNARGWSVNLNEIPWERRASHQEGHICVVKREQGDHFTAQGLSEFLDDLLPFLSFAFGRDVRPTVVMGNGEDASMTKWGIIYGGNSPSHDGRNWYLLHPDRIDIKPLFQRFCELPEQIRKQWRKVIQAYVASEEIANALRRYPVAEAVSLSSQGNRVLTEQDLEEVVFPPSGLQALALDTHLQAGFTFQQIVGDLSQGGHVLGSVVLAYPALVFPEGDVQAPVERVLDAPVSPHRCKLPVR